jgi:SAM-dependent methyltransferase
MDINVLKHNRLAWDKEVERGNRWTIPVTSEAIDQAKRGHWKIFLTPTIPVPGDWFPRLENCKVLCLASGGGQQGPLLSATGAKVTVLDNSLQQLERDAFVAERDSLAIQTVQGDMADLHMFEDSIFDLIVHPVSNTFVPDVIPVWTEAFRVLRPSGCLLAGFTNPFTYLFDQEALERHGVLQVKYSIPYSDVSSLPEEKLVRYLKERYPLEYSHTLDDQIGGQLTAGFVITGFFEDRSSPDEGDLLSEFTPIFIATKAVKPPIHSRK